MISLGYEFCYWDCRSQGDAVVMLFYSILALILTAHALRTYCKEVKKKEGHGYWLINIYIILWGLSNTST